MRHVRKKQKQRDPQGAETVMTSKDVLSLYRRGKRDFRHIRVEEGADLAGANLQGASFLGATLRRVDLSGAFLTHVQLKGADLTGARLCGAVVNATDLIDATFAEGDLSKADFTGASMNRTICTNADMRFAHFGNANLNKAVLTGANLRGVSLSTTYLFDLDVSPLCDEGQLRHVSPSSVDSRTVIKSYRNPHLLQFMIDCGVPPLFATYMIDCARALNEPMLRSLLQSTFISYGGPDEAFAKRVYEALRAHEVVTFFFPETATVGERIDTEVFNRLQEHDRILLICSRHSLERRGVLAEILETLDREARSGGATYLLPIMLDDYVLTEWRQNHPVLAERVCRRVIADFRGAKRSRRAFDAAMARVIDALKSKRLN